MNFGDPVEITRHDIRFAIAEARVQMPRRDISLVRIDTQDGAARLPRAVLIKLRKGPADAAAGQVRIHGQRVQDHDLAVFGRIQPVPVRIDVDLPLVDDAGGRHAAVKLADIQVAPVQRVLRILPDTGSYKLDLIAKSDHPAYTVVTLCFLPILPNGIISIAASRSRLKPWEFTLAMFCGSAFSVFVYCWLGSSLVQGDWIASAVLVVFMLAVAFLMWRYQKQILHFTDRLMEKRKKHHGKQHTDISES